MKSTHPKQNIKLPTIQKASEKKVEFLSYNNKGIDEMIFGKVKK